MHYIRNSFLAAVSSCVLLLSGGALASVITPSTDYSDKVSLSQTSGTVGVTDLLQINKANSSGISINKFDRFEITSSPLNIINLSSNPLDPTDKPAKLIVIVADSIVLQNTIDIVGLTTDILFISTNSAEAINCTACTFNNFYRITLASANPETTISDTVSLIGNLSTDSSGAISINGLNAPGAIALDIVANRLALKGEVNLHQKVSKDFLRSYTLDSNGNYSMGSGSANIVLGGTNWNYDEQKIISLSPTTSVSALNGEINAVGVKISSTADITVNTKIDTLTDLIGTVHYRDQVHIPIETITIQSVGAANLSIVGDQTSNGDISFKSTGHLYFDNPQTKINAAKVDLIAGEDIRNDASIEAGNVNLAANNIKNEGLIRSDFFIGIWAEKNILNQYGGKIIASTVKLQSKVGLVRNGSRTPYKSNTDSLLSLGSDYITSLDPAKLGTFYTAGMNVSTDNTNYVMASDNSATILANNIEIVGTALENINPYYEIEDSQGLINFNRQRIEQVAIIAEQNLVALTTGYIINSSAFMQVNSSQGTMHLKTGLLTNERYRSFSVLEKTQSSDGSIINIESKNTIYSPPGDLLSMGDLDIEASEGFINNTAYVEVYGSAQFDSPMINDIGVAHEALSEATVSRLEWHTKYVSYLWWKEKQRYTVTITDTIITLKRAELDSLFHIQGDTVVLNSEMEWFRNHEPIDTYIEQAAEKLTSGDFNISEDVSEDKVTMVVDSVEYSVFDELIKLYNELVNYFNSIFAEINWWGEEA